MDDRDTDVHYLDKRLALAFVREQAWRMGDAGGELNMSEWVDPNAVECPAWLEELRAIVGENVAARFVAAAPDRAAYLGWFRTQ